MSVFRVIKGGKIDEISSNVLGMLGNAAAILRGRSKEDLRNRKTFPFDSPRTSYILDAQRVTDIAGGNIPPRS